MEVIYSLIPGMLFFGLIFVGVLFWAIKKGQYEDLEGDAHRILMDDEGKTPAKDDEATPNEPRKRVGFNYPDQD